MIQNLQWTHSFLTALLLQVASTTLLALFVPEFGKISHVYHQEIYMAHVDMS